MSAKRKRPRAAGKPPPPSIDHDQVQVEDEAAELLALWRVFPAALARDSAGTLAGGGRHQSGAVDGSPSPGNVSVMDAAALVETGLYAIAAEAVPLLNLERMHRSPAAVIAALPDWHRALSGRSQPLAKHLRSDLSAWLREARGAIGVRRHDRKLGPMCPEHRAERPTPLLEVGATAQLDAVLIAGPPGVHHPPVIGPLCPAALRYVARRHDLANPAPPCGHASCQVIADRRVVVAGTPSDWVLTGDDEVAWDPLDGRHALRWMTTSVIRCPRCKLEWTSTPARRMLAQRLVELGDHRVDVAAAMSS